MLNQRSDKVELLRIAEAVALEKSIDKEIILTSMESAIQKAAKTRFGSENDIRAIIKKRNIDLILFFLCDMQCCMATVKDNLAKTEDQTNEIVNLARKLGSKVVFGGSGLQFLPSIEKSTDFNFIKFADLKKLIS